MKIEIQDIEIGKVLDAINKIYPNIADVIFRADNENMHIVVHDGALVSFTYVKFPVISDATKVEFYRTSWKELYRLLKKAERGSKVTLDIGTKIDVSLISPFKVNAELPMFDLLQDQIEVGSDKKVSPIKFLDEWKFDESMVVSREHFKKAIAFFSEDRISFKSEEKNLQIFSSKMELSMTMDSGMLIQPHNDFPESSFSLDYISKIAEGFFGETLLLGFGVKGSYPLYVEANINKEVYIKHVLAPRIGD